MNADDHTNTEPLAASFVAATLPKEAWTHQAHLLVGLWHVEQFGAAGALERLRTGIRRLNDSHGTPNSDSRGYHETITRLYVDLIAQFCDALPADLPMEERARRLLASPIAARDVALQFYSRDVLFSVAARRHWVEPDLRSLAEARSL